METIEKRGFFRPDEPRSFSQQMNDLDVEVVKVRPKITHKDIKWFSPRSNYKRSMFLCDKISLSLSSLRFGQEIVKKMDLEHGKRLFIGVIEYPDRGPEIAFRKVFDGAKLETKTVLLRLAKQTGAITANTNFYGWAKEFGIKLGYYKVSMEEGYYRAYLVQERGVSDGSVKGI